MRVVLACLTLLTNPSSILPVRHLVIVALMSVGCSGGGKQLVGSQEGTAIENEGNTEDKQSVEATSKYEPVAFCGKEFDTDVTEIECHDEYLAELTPLKSLGALERLDLSGSQVSNLTPLSGLSALKRIRLTETFVSDITPLAGLSLEFLGLSGTDVWDLTPLSGMISLEELLLDGTPVFDLKPLIGLSELGLLFLSNTQVTDLTPLLGLTGLTQIYLYNLQLPEAQIKKLKERRGLSVYHILEDNYVDDEDE